MNGSPSEVLLPPYARRLDVRATRAAFAAGTLGTVGDDVAREDGERYVVLRDANWNDADDVEHDPYNCSECGALLLKGRCAWCEYVADPNHRANGTTKRSGCASHGYEDGRQSGDRRALRPERRRVLRTS